MYRHSVVLILDGDRMVANESLKIELFVQEFKHSHGMQGRKQGTERLSQLFSYAAGLCLRLDHVQPNSLVQLLAE